MPPDLPTLAEQFRRGVNRERGKPVIEQLGFSVTFGNGGGAYDSADLSISCGCYSEAVPNSCVLDLPTLGRSPNAERVISAPVLTHAVRSMALAMDPDWAVAMSHAFRDRGEEKDQAPPWVGWVTYFSKQRGTVPPLPAPVRIEPVEDKGTLIVLTPERFTVANPEHVALARRVRELLTRAGLISHR
nr:immunity 52 family protein [Corallococcus sp. AB049A]